MKLARMLIGRGKFSSVENFCFGGIVWEMSRSHAGLQVYVLWLWFGPPWLTVRHTDRQLLTSYTISLASWAVWLAFISLLSVWVARYFFWRTVFSALSLCLVCVAASFKQMHVFNGFNTLLWSDAWSACWQFLMGQQVAAVIYKCCLAR